MVSLLNFTRQKAPPPHPPTPRTCRRSTTAASGMKIVKCACYPCGGKKGTTIGLFFFTNTRISPFSSGIFGLFVLPTPKMKVLSVCLIAFIGLKILYRLFGEIFEIKQDLTRGEKSHFLLFFGIVETKLFLI